MLSSHSNWNRCLVSAFVICVRVCEHACACTHFQGERQFTNLIKSSILNMYLRDMQVGISNMQLDMSLKFKGKL